MSCNENQFKRKLENLKINNTNLNEHYQKIEELVNNYRTSKSSDHLKKYIEEINKVNDLSKKIKINLIDLNICETNLRDVNIGFSVNYNPADLWSDGGAMSKLWDKVVSMCQSVSAEKSKCDNLICDKEIYSQSQCENKSILDSFFNLFDIFGDIGRHKTKITIASIVISVIGIIVFFLKKKGPTIQL